MKQNKTAVIWVKCSYIVPVEIPDDDGYDEDFDIVENHCPGTGRVGQVFYEVMEYCDEDSTCWACLLLGENEIVEKPKGGDMILKYLEARRSKPQAKIKKKKE